MTSGQMLQLIAPRLSANSRPFLLRASAFGAFPRHPAFFSTTARHANTPPPTPLGSDAPKVTDMELAQESESESASTLTINLDNPPESISCTVSPPETYAFLKPTPVVLLTAPFGGNWCFRDTWQTTLADQGYQSTSIELSMPRQPLESGDAYIRHFVKILKTSIETDHSFYPPILIAHGFHALVAQKYVESNPVSALVLVSPFIPEIIRGRFQQLSFKLQQSKAAAGGRAPSQSSSSSTGSTTATSSSSSSTSTPEAPVGDKSASESMTSSPTTTIASDIDLEAFKFDTHADVLAQDGFREAFVLPKKAVYKIDQVGKEHQERERAKEEEQKQHAKDDASATEAKKHDAEQTATTTTDGVKESASLDAETEHLGKDSVPIWELDIPESSAGTQDKLSDAAAATTAAAVAEGSLPIQTVESEASIPSPLEQLPLALYNSIPPSIFEPTFPILLVTSNADEIVSTADVKAHHVLAGQVDHIELEDLDDGGHLIMVSDNTEWEQGIQGITAWLDSNGM
ncbi:hypothetical protein BGZ99_005879 [Dissophora globulifera]|uniref:Uncharacterized protein n=1 Tax=Dissophora globulifera TaxID=979702 RepID=A0A9P6RSF2_9FUNG|nr:hypothetical protein BGZ99_005879 [Dissophora globulifera]